MSIRARSGRATLAARREEHASAALRAARLRLSIGLCPVLLFLGLPARGQNGATGTITGRILNPATGEYVRNAEVKIDASGQAAVSESGGRYRLPDVAAGTITVRVTFLGSTPATATLTVNPGATVTQDFELTSAIEKPDGKDGTFKLAKFVVSNEREGNAKALMEQRNSMNITNSVASDVFGDVAEGNVGEFLKHLPTILTVLSIGRANALYWNFRRRRLGMSWFANVAGTLTTN